MADDWERTFSDSETEAIEAAIDDSNEDVRYSLRSRNVKKKQVVKVSALSDLVGATVDGSRAAASPTACSAADAASRLRSVATSTSARAHFQLPLRVASDASGRDRMSHDDRVTRNAVPTMNRIFIRIRAPYSPGGMNHTRTDPSPRREGMMSRIRPISTAVTGQSKR